MRRLTEEEIAKLATRKGVKENAVRNFLSTLGSLTPMEAGMNVSQDARDYKWNAATVKAIRDGINLAK
jgi:hypothetical protein